MDLLDLSARSRTEARQNDNDARLWRCEAVFAHAIEARDGQTRHVQSLLVDERSRAIGYRVASTSNRWLGHVVAVAAQWIKSLNWAEQTLAADLTREPLKQPPC